MVLRIYVPEEDYGVAGRRWRGWSCLDEHDAGCDAGELVAAGSWGAAD